MPKLKLTIISLTLLLFSGLLLFTLKPFSLSAQTSTADIDPSQRDLIAFRILPNENNLSIIDWYRQQGFSGSPQFLTVDGYDAIRDGRTVYVNAANVDDNNLYTNIYLISYNQDPDLQTIDIFGGIVNNWKFNDNLNINGHCNIRTKICFNDLDCNDNEKCEDRRCKLKNDFSCFTDNHCPSGYYCNSDKAKVIRDTKRLGTFNTLTNHLNSFYQRYGFYPILGAGSYIQYNSISTWPSWQNQVLSPISANLNLLDPINSLGYCPVDDQVTCFDTTTRKFNATTSTDIVLPSNSYVFAYQGNNYGTDYVLCASFETEYELQNETSLNTITCPQETPFTHSADNQAPYIETYYLQGEAYQEFNGFIRIKDPENHPIKSVSYVKEETDFTLWANNQAPTIQDTSNPLQKRIYSPQAGEAGDYPISIKVEDIYGASSTTNLTIKIGNPAPFIEIDSFDYYLNPKKPLSFTIKMTDKHDPISFELNKINTTTPNINIATWTPATSTVGNTLYATYEDYISTSTAIQNDLTLQYRVTATDDLGASSTHRFNINLKTTPPVLDFVCPSQARLNEDYKCVLGKKHRGDFTIEFESSALPDGLELEKTSNVAEFLNTKVDDFVPMTKQQGTKHFFTKINSFFKNIFSFQTRSSLASPVDVYWVLVGKPTSTGVYAIDIKASNDFGTASERTFNLSVNTFCGDGIAQNPNMEGRGGYYNDGYEDCDIDDNVAVNAEDNSSIDRQYGCTTESADNYPILTGNHCVFKDPLNGGGFCGDGFCQTAFEHSLSCPEDCGPYCGYDVLHHGEYYPTVLIGDQCWLAKNLNVGTMVNGGIAQGSSTTDIKKYCYGDEPSNCDLYGGLYQWNQAMAGSTEEGAQGICPDGWHVPSETEVDDLKNIVKDEQSVGIGNVGKHLKSCLQANANNLDCRTDMHPRWDYYSSTIGVNTYGFSALPAGRFSVSNFTERGSRFHLLTSNLTTNNVRKFEMRDNNSKFSVGVENQNSGLSLRCIKDEPKLFVYYNVNYSAGFGGQINGNRNQLVLYGENSLQVNASPNFGYHFVKWDDDNINSERYEVNVQSDLEFEAIFAINEYSVSFDGNGHDDGSVPANIIADHGTSFTLPEANILKENYYFVNWNTQADGSGDSYNPGEVYNNITSDLTFYAQWALVSYNLSYSTDGNGYITGETNQVVVHGQNGAEVVAHPNSGYFFVRWLEDGDTNRIRQDLNITSDINRTAYFSDCGESFIDSRDGQEYNTRLIGSQCWMIDNLNIGTRIDGSLNQGSDCVNIKKYCFNNDEGQCNIRGGLYQFTQAMCGSTVSGVQGICPDGWHVPTDQEYNILENYLMEQFGGNVSCGLTTGYRCEPAATGFRDINYFNIVASGRRDMVWGNFVNSNDFYVYSSGHQHVRQISSDLNIYGVNRFTANGYNNGYAIRCIKN